MGDPFDVLGVSRDATLDEIRAARRTLARTLHPDVGGSAARMQEVNIAFEAAIAHATGRRPVPAEVPPTPARRTRAAPDRQRPRIQYDAPSFTIDALPAEAFEALLVVASWIGEVAVDDPPYVLEARLDDPAQCWCRLDLVPDAGATTVSLTVIFDDPLAPALDVEPDVETVRDVWVANLNRLGRLPD